MANKFQVGQTVRHVKRYDGKDSTRYTDQHLGGTFVITDVNTGWTYSPDPYWYQNRETGDSAWESNLELIEPHTPYTVITPKVGEKYRMLKGLESFPFSHLAVGEIIEHVAGVCFRINGSLQNIDKSKITTEYLELVSSAPEFDQSKIIKEIQRYADQWHIPEFEVQPKPFRSLMYEEPINQSIIQKTMTMLRKLNDWQKRTFNKDIAVQYEVGFINEDLTPTAKAKEELTNILLTEYNDKLTARAEEIKKEMLEAEKDK